MSGKESNVKRICLSPGTLGSGGIGRNMLNLAKSFQNKGIEVDLVFTGDDHHGRENEIPPDVHVFKLASRSRYALLPAVKYLRLRKPELLISAHHYVNILMLIAHRLSGLGSNCHTVCTFQTFRTLELKHSGLQARFYDWLAFKFYKFADSLVAVSKGVAENIEESSGLPKGSVRVIYNPAWSSEMERRSQADCSEPWLVGKEIPVLISVGRLTKQKDFQTLLRAFARLIGNMEARLIILGEGEERGKLESLISSLGLDERVNMPGHVSNPLAYMARSDLFVLSSAWEGFGNVIVEALGCGLSVVSTDCLSGPREILADGEYGKLVPVGNDEKLAEAMESLLLNPFLKKRQKERAQIFNDDRAAEEYLDLARTLK